mmetsp:Transcript_67972/g.210515  ORF Transcript_67972/g.210515 Transcript_67972/m.210515 type:complete len:130 (-) Transcript_67972:197-586(-)
MLGHHTILSFFFRVHASTRPDAAHGAQHHVHREPIAKDAVHDHVEQQKIGRPSGDIELFRVVRITFASGNCWSSSIAKTEVGSSTTASNPVNSMKSTTWRSCLAAPPLLTAANHLPQTQESVMRNDEAD